MTEGITQNLVQKTQEAPKTREKLSDEEMGNLLSAVGNHEAKAITLILMGNGNNFDAGRLYRKILKAQGKHKGWVMNKNNPFSYCTRSLSFSKLVEEKKLNTYQITPKGKGLGIPLAGLLLDFSEKHNIPLSQLLGLTLSSSKEKAIKTEEGEVQFRKRAPLTTLKILYELLTSSSLPVREVDIARGIGEDFIQNLAKHFIRLSKLGLIKYEAVEVNKPYSLYKLSSNIPEGQLPIYINFRTLTNAVFDVLRKYSGRDLTREDVYNLLSIKEKERWKKKNLLLEISGILSFFNKKGYVDVKKFERNKQSEINITEEQRMVLTEFLEIMDRFRNQDPEILEKGRRFAEEIVVNPERISKLLRRAKEASSNASRSSPEEIQENILSIILSNPGATNIEIQKLLEKKHGKKLRITSIRILSSLLVKQKSIKVVKEGSLGKFYPND